MGIILICGNLGGNSLVLSELKRDHILNVILSIILCACYMTNLDES